MSTMMKRDDYKTVKRMNREQMSAYLVRIFERGYKAALKQMRSKPESETLAPETNETPDQEPDG